MKTRGDINKKDIQDILDLTPMQKGMLFHYQMNPESKDYVEQIVFRINGNIGTEEIKNAWVSLVAKHENLRSVFRWEKLQTGLQIVLKNHDTPFLIENLDQFNDTILEDIKERELNKGIDLTDQPIRVCLVNVGNHTHIMILVYHHILWDGWSSGILHKEFKEACRRSMDNKPLMDPVQVTPWKEYVKLLKAIDDTNASAYWKNYLDNYTPTNFSLGHVKGNPKSETNKVQIKIEKEELSKIKELCKINNHTIAGWVHAAWGILQSRYSMKNDVVFGSTVSGRNREIKDIDKMVGLFINTLPIRIQQDEETRVYDLIRQVEAGFKDMNAYEATPMTDIKQYCGIKGNEDLFDTIVVYENYPNQVKYEEKIDIEVLAVREETHYGIATAIMETNEGLDITIYYKTDQYTGDMINKLSKHYGRIIELMTDCYSKLVTELDILDTEEVMQLKKWNSTERIYPTTPTIVELFEEQVSMVPNNIAVKFENKSISYRELDDRASRLACVLREKGVKRNTIVGLMVERSIEMIVGIMAVLKAGGAYLPLNPDYPKERISYMLEDSGASILLTQEKFYHLVDRDREILVLEDHTLYKEEFLLQTTVNVPTDRAYVIYTSGSTGKPKGVAVSHKALHNFLCTLYDKFDSNVEHEDRCLSLANISFDASVGEIFLPLVYGAKLVLFNNDAILDINKVAKILIEEKITFAYIPPTILNHVSMLLMESKEKVSVNKLLVGVEPIRDHTLNEYIKLNHEIKIVNGYGPTEATICATMYRYENHEPSGNIVPIGMPTNNTKIYIFDNANHQASVGIPGELCISGDLLAEGYINNPELTAEKFVQNPYQPGERMYRTGDLARWLSDGNIEFLGRIDHQVKIRGYRIELGEIENQLLSHESVKEVIVIGKKDQDDLQFLCGYIVADKKLQVAELREELQKKLPEYMIPSYFIQLEKMPLTANGKIDRRALPEPDGSMATGVPYEAPRNEIEETLVAIWRDVLVVDKVGINDNFFELGGHSLKATMLVGKIHKALDVVVPLSEVFKTPTIKGISEYLRGREKDICESISPVEEKEYYEASSAQKRMYMLQQFDKDSIAYNMPVVFELQGNINQKRIEETFKKLINRHEALRTYFDILDREIVQKVQNSDEFNLIYSKENENIEDKINSFVRPFDLQKAPLFRVELVEDLEKAYLLVDMHHIISDGMSMSILIKEFTELYSGKTLEPLKIQYKDFATWQNSLLESEEIKKQEKYWINRFKDEIPVLNMPIDYERPAIQSYEGDQVNFEVDKEITLKLKRLTQETGTTMHMVLLSAFNVLLSKYSGQEDIVIGTPIAGRPHTDLQNIMGMFVNTLALRNKPQGDKKFVDFLNEVRENSLRAYENQSYQLETLVEKLEVRRDISRNPLFDVMFNVVDTVTAGEIKLDDVVLKEYNRRSKIAKFDLILNAVESDGQLNFDLEYCTKLFKKETIERISNHYLRILDSIVTDKEIRLSDVNPLTEAEKNQILYEFNDTKVDYPKDKTIQDLFESQVEKTPDNIAIVFKDTKLTYRELNEKANQLARLLIENEVKSETIVGIMVERSLEMIIGILATLKAGGAYLPIDPTYPKDRIKYMIEDSGTNLLLTQSTLMNSIEFHGGIVTLDKMGLNVNNHDNLSKVTKGEDLAYIIYTSGSTGKPKGVMVEHRGIVNLNQLWSSNFKINKDDKIVQFASNSFDASVWEIFMALLSGAELHIISEDIAKNYRELEKYIESNDITTITLPPVYLLNMDFENTKSLKRIISAGSELSASIVEKWNEQIELINAYGPTEASICATVGSCKGVTSKTVPIGKPIQNTNVYIVNKNDSLQPIGVIGELYIGGAGIARGYLNKPELTTEKFIVNSFTEGDKVYKTGDLARWLPDGNIEFIGRVDHQVKVRGYRIELGEIENQLLKYEDIKEAIVIAKQDKAGHQYLVGYVVGEKEIAVEEVREYLGKELPQYMIPSYIMQLDKMPLISNGKIDRGALPQPDGNINTGVKYEAPRNEIEEKLAVIWKEVLGLDQVGIHDNFFNLGGHSLKATVLSGRIQKELEIEVGVKDIFTRPTIIQLAEQIMGGQGIQYGLLKPLEKRESYLVSSAQRRLYAIQMLDSKTTAYNTPMALELTGNIDRVRIEKAIGALINKHEALRTSFHMEGEEIVQRIHEKAELKLQYLEVEGREKAEEIMKDWIKPFELDKCPIMRGGIINTGNEYLLMLDMHHIISDGVTMSILAEDFVKAYEGKELKAEAVQYKEYAQWEKEQKENGVWEKQKEYWKSIFEEDIPVLDLPMDGIRGKAEDSEGGRIHFEVDEETVKALKEAVKAVGGTLYMGLLAGYSILLSRYSRQEDIVIGSPIAGRRHPQLEKIVGMFVNTLAIRTKPEGEKSIKDFLVEMKKTMLDAYENQEFPYEELIKELNVRRDLSRNPLFDAMLVLQNMEVTDIKLPGSNVKLCEVDSGNSQFDITLSIMENQEKLSCEIEYRSKLYSKGSIEQMIKHYIRILEQIGSNLNQPIKAIDLLNQEEKQLILKQFNDSKVEYDKNRTVIDLFEEQVSKNPDAIAVVHGEEKLTYRQLNDRANKLAKKLRKAGVTAESIVAIISEADCNFIVEVIGVLKAGGAYLPILPEYPIERIKYMIKDSGAAVILNPSGIELEEYTAAVLDIWEEDYLVTSSDVENANYTRAENAAYVIYTSGSTGQPKGVLIEHKSLNNIITGHIHDYGYGKMQEQMLFAQIVFDVSVLHIFTPLCSRNTLHLMTDIMKSNYKELYKYVKRNNIGFIDMVPAQMEAMMDYLDQDCANIRFVLGGEAFPVSLYQKLIKRINPEEIYNAYGPTETTITALMHECSKNEKGKLIPIGKPVRNYRVYILDQYNRIQPIGVPGALFISGDGLARGYLNRQQLTAESFVKNPYETEEKMYKTGDLARWLTDGSIEFWGRIDQQVKIRGYRIELGEIENVIVKQPGVKEAVVLDREELSGGKYLCGYIVKETNVTMDAIKKAIANELPQYMVPSVMVEIDEIPLTSNGKINRRALLDIEVSLARESQYQAPRNDIEAKLVDIWEDILGINPIGIHDNFFDLGGHSLKATVLMGRILKELEVEIGVRDIFERPTIIELAEKIMGGQTSQYDLLKPLEKRESYVVSSAQRRMYAIQMMGNKSTAYNMPMALELTGNVDRGRIERAIEALINKHEALRTSFHMEGEEILQRIHEKAELKLQYIEIEETEDAEEIIKSWIKPFELDQSPIIRGGIIKTNNKYLLMLDMHHIISDGVTIGILADDFVRAYEGEELKVEAVQYKEYAQWEKEQKESGVWEKQKQYWKQVYEGEIPVLDLPVDGIRGKLEDSKAEGISFEIGEETVKALKETVKAVGGTLYMGLMAGYSILLSRYSRQEDIVIGSPIAGRRHPQLEKISGMFVNTLAIRTKPEGQKSIKDFLLEMKQTLLGAYENQEFPYEELVEELNVRRDLSRNPLFDVMLVLQNTDMKQIELPEVQIRQYGINSQRAKLDLTINIEEVGDKLVCEVEYKSKLYNRNSIERMMKHYIKILEEISAENKTIKEIELIDEEEKDLLQRKFNDTRVEYEKNKTIVDLFEEQVEKTPDHLAVVYKDDGLTYRELNEKSNQLARMLREKGVKPDGIVGIMVDPSLEMLIGIFGILKAGGAYLPIDTNYPADRIKYILRDSGTIILLQKGMDNSHGIEDIEGIAIDGDYTDYSKENLETVSNYNNLAYVIYTSGSTGKPKGAMIKQRGLVNYITWADKVYVQNESLDFPLYSSFSFDLTVTSIFTPLISGNKIVVYKEEKDEPVIRQVFKENKVGIVKLTPAHLGIIRDIDNSNSSIKRLILGGEDLKTELAKEVYEKFNKNVEIYNEYGPTETVVGCMIHKYDCHQDRGITVPIGKPADNVQIYILDEEKQLLPIGIAGEIYIGGDGVSKGYINREDLTAERFIPNPFVPGEKMYRSGDLARWLHDGNIEFLGRIDHQVKIRGFRIELGEIENSILQHESIKEAAVVVKEKKDGDKYICAYVVNENSLEELNLKSYLKETLPEYMIPAYFVQLDNLPLTSNGKLDRKALPEPNLDAILTEYEAPRNELEIKLARIWAEVLGIDIIGINDDFFELGGHSIKAIKLLGRIHQECGIKLDYQTIYSYPNIKEVAKYISSNNSEEYDEIQALEGQEYYETSYVQKRMWLLNQMEPTSTAYNMPGKITIRDKDAFRFIKSAFEALVSRHEAFRTSFEDQYGVIVQKIEEGQGAKLDYEDLSGLQQEKKIERLYELEVETFFNLFDLTQAPLFRCKCIKVDESHFEVLFCMHHIISDGWSIEIMKKEFEDYYSAIKTGKTIDTKPLRIQYKDFAFWQNESITKNMDKALGYWQDKLVDFPHMLNLPERSKNKDVKDDQRLSIFIEKHTTDGLNKLVAKNHSSIFSLFLTSLYVILSRITGQKDIVIGTAVSGREHYETEDVIGCFVNTLLLREQVVKEEDFESMLKRVSASISQALTYQTYPLELVLEKAGIKYPDIQVFLNVLNLGDANALISDNQADTAQGIKAKFDIEFYVIPTVEGIRLICEYKSSKFDDADISFIVNQYIKIIEDTIEDSQKSISELGIKRRKKLGK